MSLGVLSASFVFAQTDASVTPLTPGWGGPNYDQRLWTITYNKAVIPVSFTSYHCTSAALVLEYATWADYTKLDWQTGKTNQYTGFIPASASDLSQKVNITIPNLSPSTAYTFRVGAKCTSSSPMGTLAYTMSANQFSTPAAPPPADTTPPDVPFNLTVNDVTSTHASLGWSFRSDDLGIARWELKYKMSGGPILDEDWASASSLPMTQSASPLTVGGTVGFGYNEFTPSTTYMLGLKAYDVAGNASSLAVFPSFTTLAPPPPSIPIAPTELTATYSTANLGQREIVLTVKDNATNETEYRLYWRLLGTAWPSTFQSFSANIGNIHIAAPGTAGTYEYQAQACNSVGCSSSNIVSIQIPAAPIITPGFCIVINNLTSMPAASAPDLGTGYAKISKPGVATLTGTIDACSGDDFNALMQSYCTRNSAQAQTEVWAENTTACSKTGCNYNACPASSNNSQTNTTTGTSSGGTTTIMPVTSPPSGIPSSTPTTSAPTPPASATTPNINSTGSVNEINPAVNLPSTNQSVTQPQTAPSVLSRTQCTRYLSTIKNIFDSNERYVKTIKQKMRNAPENYVNFNAVTASFENANDALRDGKNLIKNGECSKQTIGLIRDKQSDLSNVLQDISAYHTSELRYFRTYAQCKSTLANRTKRINTLIKKEKNKQTKSSLQDTVSEIAQKSQEFAKDAASSSFPEVITQCKDYVKGLDDDVNFYQRHQSSISPNAEKTRVLVTGKKR